MGTGHIGIILLVISVTLFSIIPSSYAASSASVSIPSGTSVPGCEQSNACYIPYSVTIDVGGEVTWSNDDSAAHTVTSGTSAGGPDGNFDSSLFMAGTTFSVVLDNPGGYPYHCMVHPWMEGMVIVEGNQAPPEISVTTSKNSYTEGETIVVSGHVTLILEGAPVSIQILREGNLVDISSHVVASDGTFSGTFKASGPLWQEDGLYIVRVLYGTTTLETSFEFFTSNVVEETTDSYEVDAGSYGTFDVDYSISGANVNNMLIDSEEFALVVILETGNDGFITLNLPRSGIDAKKSDGTDDTFIIRIDGIEVPYQEISTYSNSRKIKIDFEEGDSDIKIIGTFIVGTKPPSTIGSPITVSTDKSSYKGDEFLRISGEVREILSGFPVTFQLIAASGDIVTLAQLEVDSNKKFGVTLETGGPLWSSSGTYIAKVLYASEARTAQTTFQYTSSYPPESESDIFDWIDLSKYPQYYLDRYYNESAYRAWFDTNFPSYTIEEAMEIAFPDYKPDGQIDVPIIVYIDKSSYKDGDTIKIFGEIREFLSGSLVELNIIAANGNLVTLAQLEVGADKKFGVEVTSGGPLWRSTGEYTVRVEYGTESRTDEITFYFSGTDPEPTYSIQVSTDRSSYKKGDIIVVSGKVGNPQDYEVVLRVTNPRNVPVYQQNLALKSDGSFGDMIIAGDDSHWTDGTYVLKATHNSKSTIASFLYRDSSTSPSPSPSTARVSVPSGTSVPGCEETNSCFIPFEVRVARGGEVTWSNNDSAAHTVTSGTAAEGPSGVFDSSLFMAGTTFSVSFDEDGTIPYFCMVHPWMIGVVVVGQGGSSPPPPPTPSPDITISVNTDRSLYDLGDIVSLSVTLSGTSQSQNVAISVTDPTGHAVVSRTLTTDSSGRASTEFGIHEDFKTGTYTTTATVSVNGVTYKDTSRFKIESQFNQIRLVSVQGTDQQGNPSSFARGDLGFVKVVVSANKPIATLVTVNLFDSELTTIGIASFRTTLSTGESEMILSFLIPEDTTVGTADIYANAFSDWPSNGGVPQTGEFSAQVRIT